MTVSSSGSMSGCRNRLKSTRPSAPAAASRRRDRAGRAEPGRELDRDRDRHHRLHAREDLDVAILDRRPPTRRRRRDVVDVQLDRGGARLLQRVRVRRPATAAAAVQARDDGHVDLGHAARISSSAVGRIVEGDRGGRRVGADVFEPADGAGVAGQEPLRVAPNLLLEHRRQRRSRRPRPAPAGGCRRASPSAATATRRSGCAASAPDRSWSDRREDRVRGGHGSSIDVDGRPQRRRRAPCLRGFRRPLPRCASCGVSGSSSRAPRAFPVWSSHAVMDSEGQVPGRRERCTVRGGSRTYGGSAAPARDRPVRGIRARPRGRASQRCSPRPASSPARATRRWACWLPTGGRSSGS